MIIVTGGAGFIGSNLVAALNDRGLYEVVVVDRLGDGAKWRNLAKRELAGLVAPGALFGFLDAHAPEIEAVFHLGAISSTTETDTDLIAENNFALSLRLWEWCGWRGTRLIYASSAATYGDGAAGFDDALDVEALARLRPLNAYGWSKHLFDRRIARLVGIGAPTPRQWAGLKFFNVYGPNEYHKGAQRSVVAHLWPRVVADEPAVLFRSHRPGIAHGDQARDFVWVGDCVAVLLWLYDNPPVCGLFNVGSGTARSFKDLATAVFAAAGKPPRIDYVDTPVEIRDKYQYFTEARLERLRAAGFTAPTVALEDGVRRYVREFLMTDDPYR
ncbi:MAG TPA: ADP-glyceromanno-heptose 6-epimerase [Candidatus Sulfotelmatobacter sp.]|nr:ADP-glyceromanno-heptose 6-epimerase [Candidatus Sulfotelmatobacter sp.]